MLKNHLLKYLLTLSLLLAGCGSDNSGNTQETEIKEFVPVSEMYDGYEQLQGKDFGNFKLPESIEKPEFEKLYRFPDRRGGADVPDEETRTKELLKRTFGEEPEESLISAYENWDGSKTYTLTLPEGRSAAVLHGFPISIIKSAEELITPQQELIHEYSPEDGGGIVELKNSSCSVSELLDNMQKRLESEVMQGLEGFEFVPRSISNFRNSNSVSYTQIEYEVYYRGIKLEYDSPMSVLQSKSEYQVMTSYSINSVSLTAADKEDYAIFSSTFSEQYPLTEEVTEAISLERAVQILQNELAQYSFYDFDSVELCYCCKITAPVITNTDKDEDSRILADYGEIETAYFEPTWCFNYTGNPNVQQRREAVKVNAVTGEITIDK